MDNAVKKTKAWEYSEKVLSGEILACEWVKLACERFQKDTKRKDLIFDLNEVDKFTRFAEKIVYVPEIRKTTELPLPYAFVFQQVYGWKYKNGKRRFTNWFIEVGRKNWKTYYSAVFSLYELILGNDTSPEILHGANSRDQALYCTNMCGKIIRASPELKKLEKSGVLKLFTNKEEFIRIFYRDGNRTGKIEAIPRDLGDGGNPSASVIDEYHEAMTNKLVETIESGQGERVQPINGIISSPGFNKAGPLYLEIRDLSIKTLKGSIKNDSLICIMYEQDNEEDWDNFDFIEKANPMVYYSEHKRDYVKKRIKEAKVEQGSKQVSVQIKNCGVWTDSAQAWVEDSIWVANHHPQITKDDLLGLTCWGGIDLASTRDLSSYSLLFKLDNVWEDVKQITIITDDGEEKIIDDPNHFIYPALNWNWSPEDYRSRYDYTKWIQEGHIKTVEGNHIEQSVLLEYWKTTFQKYKVKQINYDKKLMDYLSTMIQNEGVPAVPLNMQGAGVTQSIMKLEETILAKKIHHFNNPVLRWSLGNCVAKVNERNHVLLTKENEFNKIDPIVSLVLAFDAMSHNESQPESFAGVINLG